MSQIGETILKELKLGKKKWEETPYAVNVNKTGEQKRQGLIPLLKNSFYHWSSMPWGLVKMKVANSHMTLRELNSGEMGEENRET